MVTFCPCCQRNSRIIEIGRETMYDPVLFCKRTLSSSDPDFLLPIYCIPLLHYTLPIYCKNTTKSYLNHINI